MAADSIPAPLVEACGQVRLATKADAVGAVQPSFVASPASTAQASGLLRAAADLGLTVLPRGTGSKLAWGNPPERADLVVETTGMDRVIEHAAGDLVASVEAGVSLDRLAEVLKTAGQRLALDPPSLGQSGRGTVGGVLASGAAGPLRLRYGTGRDLLIGITVVRADGTVAKSGGKVVKNVAGYDLGKLFAGSRGTLGLITEATFRLHPLPVTTAYVTIKRDGAADVDRLFAICLQAPLAPVAAELDWPTPNAPMQLCLALEGDADGVSGRAAQLADELAEFGESEAAISGRAPGWWGGGAAAQRDGTVLQVAFWAGDLGKVLAEINVAADQADLRVAVGGSAAGLLYAWVRPADDATAIASFVTSLRSAVGHREITGDGRAPGRASVVVQHAPVAVGELVDHFGPVPSLGLMRAVKHQFDPERMMSPGRFVGGL
jgi:glycolate oxidase FAD binding subunit